MSNPQRVSVSSSAKMIACKGGQPVTPPSETTTLYGWLHPPVSTIVCVKLDDGREMLIAYSDLTAVTP